MPDRDPRRARFRRDPGRAARADRGAGRRAAAGSPRAKRPRPVSSASRRAAATSPLRPKVSPTRCWRRRAGSLERRKLRDYQSEDVRARPKRFEYEILLRLIGERSADAGGEDDAWDRAAELQRGCERRPRRDARQAARRIRARRRPGARLRPALAQHPGGALVPAFRRQRRLGPHRRRCSPPLRS